MKFASYSIEENCFGKRGMCHNHKYLMDSEMRSFTASCIEDKKQMQKDSAQDIDLQVSNIMDKQIIKSLR
jgi:hypothetical protein